MKHKILSLSYKYLVQVFSRTQTKERNKRGQEVLDKLAELRKNTIGEEADKEMLYVRMLCTAPEYQGHGYATALLNTIADMADSQHRAILLEALEYNVPFYTSNGYVNLGYTVVGDDNPTWGKDPINIHLLVRLKNIA